jgi:hypothetical protein
LEKLFPADGSTPGLRPRFVPIKVRQGEEANCLNLNRVLAPRLLGISPSAMSERRAFLPKAGVNVWDLLAAPLPDGSIPGLAGDLNTAMWGIRKRVGPDRGESLLYADERGRPFRVKLVGALPVRVSVLQGNVIMPDWAFTQLFPSEGGHRMFLADACGGAEDRWRRDLSAAFERDGLDVTPCADRLREFSGVETTYLAMFLVLGGLGLALGTVGIGVVLAWNVAERRVELAILRAVGYREGMIRRLVLGEHLALLAAGLTCGTISAWVAAWPNWHAAQMGTPWRQALGMLLAMAVVGVFSTLAAVRVSLRADPIRSLRNE